MTKRNCRLLIFGGASYNTPVQKWQGRERSRSARTTICVAAFVTLVLWTCLPRVQAQPGARRLAVATESKRASTEAMKQLTLGGNAVDAAVTAALVAGVTSPASSGIGGGAFIHLFHRASGKTLVLDARETAPAAVAAREFDTRPFAPEARGKHVGVPGELLGLFEVHRRFGKRTWAEVVAPAIEAAERGFEVEPHLGRMLQMSRAVLAGDPGLKGLWFQGGPIPKVSARVMNAPLAATLRRIAAEGPRAFYEGPIAAELVNTVRQHGGALSLGDLQNYRVIEREALRVNWGEFQVHTMPPPSAGGLMLVQALKLYTPADVQRLGNGTAAWQHALAKAFRGSIADRMRYLGDPAYEPVNASHLTSDARMLARRGQIALNRTQELPSFTLEEHGTHHLVTADAEGNLVALTTTVNRGFGAKLMAVSSGVLLNDELDDFTSQADVAPFGMSVSPNRARGGARPVSSMTPTIVTKNGRGVLAIGGSGGTTIATNTAQLVLTHLAFGTPPARLVAGPRFQIPTSGQVSLLVPASTPETVRQELERRGEVLADVTFNFSGVQAISVDAQGNKAAGADPQKHGLALVR